MRKWVYFGFPAVMLAVFIVFYMASKKQWDAAEAARVATEHRAKAADDAKKASAEEAARIAAKKRADDQRRDDEARERARVAKWEEDTRAIRAVAEKARAEAEADSKESAALEIESDKLRKQKEKENREDFELLKAVELARTREQTAELDIQRMLTMISNRATLGRNASPEK